MYIHKYPTINSIVAIFREPVNILYNSRVLRKAYILLIFERSWGEINSENNYDHVTGFS